MPNPKPTLPTLIKAELALEAERAFGCIDENLQYPSQEAEEAGDYESAIIFAADRLNASAVKEQETANAE